RGCGATVFSSRRAYSARPHSHSHDHDGGLALASTSSFDVTTGVDAMEVTNAVDQTTKEITQRYDFKGVKTEITYNQKEKTITLAAPDEYKLKAIWDVLQSKCVRRGVPLKNLKPGDVQPASMGSARQVIAIQDGL